MSTVVIQRVIVELRGLRRDAGHAWHERVSRWVRDELPGRIAASLDALPDDDHLLLGRVEVDVGRAGPMRLERSLERGVSEALERSARQSIGSRSRLPSATGSRPAFDDPSAPRAGSGPALHDPSAPRAGPALSEAAPGDASARWVSADERAATLLQTFLTSGVLPWWAPSGWRVGHVLDPWLEASEPWRLLALLRELAPHPEALARLALHLDPAQRERLLAHVRPGLERWLSRWRALPGVADDAPELAAVTEILLRRALASPAASLPVWTPTSMSERELEGTEWLEHVLASLQAKGLAPRRRGVGSARVGGSAATYVPRAWLRVWDRTRPQARDAGRSRGHAAPDGSLARSTLGERAGSSAEPALRDVPAGEGPRSGAAELRRGERPFPHGEPPAGLSGPDGARARVGGSAELEGVRGQHAVGWIAPEAAEATPACVAVSQAGSVLLWPFLPAFFDALGLREAGAFVPGGCERAVHLLHYAATGLARAEEHELVLPKLLCGFELERPIAPVSAPTADERAQVRELLASVIEHWSALGQTSPEGLQRSFLYRPGQLSLGESPLLRIERRGYDVLLDRLPYTISIIKLSFMRAILRTEW